ncbi:MAG: 16S rRNA (adenine(1518)-N(6)/adenine(1519)-N(6))-dimethyltransferase RsmA [Gemmatimonadota bacterium]|nr:16S rRNA (adenine(1518)-N(6)/adenine(1519)-N(6))-dimethyltransferase RsmA [Gemmatimonadota bacterium]
MSRRPPDAPRAKRSLGQNFLIDPKLQRAVVDVLAPGPEDEVLEIGPGQGALTRHLVGRVRRLVLVEKDDVLAARLRDEFAAEPSVKVIHADILEVRLESISPASAELKVIGNIPYNITTPILFSLLERRPRPRSIVLMVQREVADRIVAAPGGKDFGALAVGVQTVAGAERVLHVGRGAFRPVPKVESSVVRITPYDPPRLSEAEEAALRRLSRAAFGQRRKQFQRILRDAYTLSVEEVKRLEQQLGVDLQARPETFGPDQFVRLARALTG